MIQALGHRANDLVTFKTRPPLQSGIPFDCLGKSIASNPYILVGVVDEMKEKPMDPKGRRRRTGPEYESGFSLLELLTTVSLASILTGIGIVNLRLLVGSSTNAAFELTSYLKHVRAKAIATTSAYTVRAVSNTNLISESSTNCTSLIRSADAQLAKTLPSGAQLNNTGWSVCFTSKGASTSNITIPLTDENSSSQSVEVLLGGTVRVL
jgi:prepilin-type N-terminal cleavage/methylation domain-containing protein